jgi:Flp pilus assembly protein TadD
MLYIIPIILIVISAVGIAVIIIRRLPSVAIIDVETVPKEQEARVKKRILAERMGRGWKKFFKKFFPFLRSRWQNLRAQFYGFFNRMKHLERRGKKRTIKNSDVFLVIPELLSRAQEEIKKKAYGEAEHLLVEALGHDAKNIEAYRFLGDIYIEEKKYGQAKGTYEFILKLDPENENAIASLAKISKLSGDFVAARDLYLKAITINDKVARYFSELGVIFKNLNEEELAFNNFLKANALEPNSPRTLDFLIDSSIILKKKELAETLLQKLREVNSDNQKLQEFEEKIKLLPTV